MHLSRKESLEGSKKPILTRSPPSIQLTTLTAHAQYSNEDNTRPTSRTQYKMMLQRQSFLADDKNHLDHPENMRRLTKELDRVNREYKSLKQYQDPLALSIQRVLATHHHHPILFSPTSPSTASSISSTCSQSPPPTRLLQRRASSHTVHDYLFNFKQEERRHSFSLSNDVTNKSTLIHRLFSSSQQPSLKRS